MTFGKRLSAVIILSALCVAPPVVRAQSTAPTEAIDKLASALLSSDEADRNEAARRLVARCDQDPQIQGVLTSVLKDPRADSRGAQLAVMRALAIHPSPPEAFVDPLCIIVTSDNPSGYATNAAAQALAAYDGRFHTIDRMKELATYQRLGVNRQVSVIHAMGRVVSKEGAQALVENFLLPADVNGRLRIAACEALEQMTGETANGSEVEKWKKWWEENRNKGDIEFTIEPLKRKATGAKLVEERYRDLCAWIGETLDNTYKATPEPNQNGLMLGWLRTGPIEVRSAAIGVLQKELEEKAKPPQPPVLAQLIAMVGDSSPEVRKKVALTLQVVGKEAAIEPLLAQLRVERDSDVSASIATALGKIHAKAAIEDLQGKLSDPSFRVRQAAAGALKLLITDLKPGDQATQGTINGLTDALRAAVGARDVRGNPAAGPLRQSLYDAMAVLKNPALLQDFHNALADDDPWVQRAALQGIGLIGNPASASVILKYLTSPYPIVRLETARALQVTASPANVRDLYERWKVEADPDVKSAVDDNISSLIPQGTLDQARQWEILFAPANAGPPPADRTTDFLLAALDRQHELLQKDKALEPLAKVECKMGDIYSRAGKYDKACIQYDQAASTIRGVAVGDKVFLQQLHLSRIEAWLHQTESAADGSDQKGAAEAGESAARAAGEAIAGEKQYTDLVLADLQKTVVHLTGKRKTEEARRLVQAFLKIDGFDQSLNGKVTQLLQQIRATTTGESWLIDRIWPQYAVLQTWPRAPSSVSHWRAMG